MQSIAENISVSPDSLVIEKIINGDVSLFEVLIRRYNPVLYKIARSYSFNHQDAEDLMQDVHVIAYTQLSKFEGRASYKTWISRIMVNKCLYKLKYGYFKNEVPHEDFPNHQPMHNKANENQTEDRLLNRELTVVLERSLQNIPVMYRTVFVLREAEGFSVAETAQLLNITPVNVKVRLNRAKALLQKQVEKFYSHADLYSFNLVYCDGMVQKVFEQINKIKKEDSETSVQ
ncbi:sigma-70 family RNA polymerase sigma factor [Flavisolibacter ginsenosidimutans]|uniref:Sigma-70 family RNA polymerase sigma factor n=1 Tax=Flavisolibacter ginsenosidimutans TaxID=661481 RepID=A0A5B8UDI4_9BACT|nr:sigma-70 family RNA polymerase sigma factor [Flavisolibacter ginsenosidimutans]QEC54472.1 sigma-70 family RNA polymerase sigma factor [Flavisolibacter ginsenosidimutans]